MKTKILYLLFVLLMCFSPTVVFADSVYYEVMHDGSLTIVEIDENRKLICKDEYEYDLTQLELNLSRRDAQKMMNYFKSYINEDDIVEYAPNKNLMDYGDGNYLDNGYILRICEESECKEYFSENPIIPKEETDYGEIYKLRKKEDTKFMVVLLLSIALIIVIPIIVIASIVLLIVLLCLKRNKR